MVRRRSPGVVVALICSAVLIGTACGEVEVAADAEDPEPADAGDSEPPDAVGEPDATVTGQPDAGGPPDAAQICEPGASTCSDDIESQCDDTGQNEEHRVCDFGCDDAGLRCVELQVSNGLGEFLANADEGPELELDEESLVSTNGFIIVDGDTIDVPSELLSAPENGVEVRVFSVKSLDVTGTVSIEGDAALAFVAEDEIRIDGLLSVAGREDESGPGVANDRTGGPGSRRHVDCGTLNTGGGGGAFGADGGDGGDIEGDEGSANGGFGGRSGGNDDLVPLRGGSRGGGADGRGGGAVQLVSRTSISIRDGGVIDAGGAGGDYRGTVPGGGGSGGGILLESPEVALSGAGSALVANGGGGGCDDGEGEDGRLDGQRAAGCVSGSMGDGGRGGAGTSPEGEAAPEFLAGDTCPAISGGGGGGVGRIRVNTFEDAFAVDSDSIISPAASTGELLLE